ncbi:MAG TPA: N,N-dimethylformamidase beta subunit family domain-containing protein [Candidatus Dormibacteraeota bacterium]|nr:N,N-dimethylformamidase beta subunit family domain-containing protein [Candidatus Dormibacteraeota bacterium]
MDAHARRPTTPRGPIAVVAVVALAAAMLLTGVRAVRADDPCSFAGVNPIPCENTQPGTPFSVWGVDGAGDPGIQGFATDISVNAGGTISFKVNTTSSDYSLTMYRLGWYQGNGARQVAVVQPSATLPQSQPACLTDPPTGLIDCGNWAASASWTVPATAVSGIYFARLADNASGAASSIPFVVRDDASTSDVLFRTDDTTWQAYNDYGGNNVYYGTAPSSNGRAFKVSYNRPWHNRSEGPGFGTANFPLYAEYPMIRWLESNGYNVSYTSSIDAERLPSTTLTQHRVLLTAGHDEYWSPGERAALTAARDAGMDMAFFSGNQSFWKIRWENAIDGSGTPYRTLVTYKETLDGRVEDPADPPTWTGTWRDPRFSPPADGGRPENALTGTFFTVNRGSAAPVVSSDFAGLRFWRNTSIASLSAGQTKTLASSTIGYEWDEDVDNGTRPAGQFDMAATSVSVPLKIRDYGATYGPGTAVYSPTMYRAASGALVFSAGTVQWAWGLDVAHDQAPDIGSNTPDQDMRQATVNVLADMGVQPATIQAGLVAGTPSTDTVAPTSAVISPSSGAAVTSGTAVTISGTAADSGGGVVAGVEVSLDGGSTWHEASGTTSWTYAWTPGPIGPVTILSRAVDDSANLGAASAGESVTVDPRPCPCTLFPSTAVPGTPNSNDPNAVELGVRFTTDTPGRVTGVRFYKGSNNTGTHVGNLWTADGQRLATGTFTGETASGWQTLTFATPVPIAVGTTYVASYHTNVGSYSSDIGFFTQPVDVPPLHAPAGTNGVFAYGASQFPNGSFNATNYWVDVVLVTGGTSTALASSANPSAFGQPVTLTATVSSLDGGGTPSGTVTFVDGSSSLGSSVLDGSGRATLTTSGLSVGDHAVTAVYGASGSWSGSSSGVTQRVSAAQTTTTVTAAPSPSAPGQAVTFTATVSPVAPGAGTPTGTVTFRDGTTTLGTGPLTVVSGTAQATFTTSALATASHSVTAVYGGGASFAASTSPAITQVVQRVTTRTVAGAFVLSLLTVSATLTRTDTGAALAGQTIKFTTGSTTICSATTNSSGAASCSGAGALLAITLNGGYTATYAGTTTYAPSSGHGGVL